MICHVKGVPLDVRYVSLRSGDDKAKSFSRLTGSTARKLPVLVNQDGDSDLVVEDAVDVTDYLENRFPELALECDDDKINTVALSLFCKFSAWMRDPVGSQEHRSSFEIELRKLDEFLGEREQRGRFLTGDSLKLPDCILLPKLHHIIVAARSEKGFSLFDQSFKNVLKYFEEAKKEPAFTDTAPENKEIEDGWREKQSQYLIQDPKRYPGSPCLMSRKMILRN